MFCSKPQYFPALYLDGQYPLNEDKPAQKATASLNSPKFFRIKICYNESCQSKNLPCRTPSQHNSNLYGRKFRIV